MRSGPARRCSLPEAAPRQIEASSASRALAVIGDGWVLRILRNAFRRTRRFSEWQAALGAPRAVLANRLERLVAAGVFARVPAGGRDEYRLTDMGLDLWRVLIAIWDWETVWNVDPAQMRLRLTHLGCGKTVRPLLTCGACGGSVSAFTCEALPGPGAGQEPGAAPRAHRRATAALRENARQAFPTEIARVHGDRWMAMIIGRLFLGDRRFGALRDALGISPALLSGRLAELEELGFIRRQEGGYRLARKGVDMFPIVMQMIRWGDRWLAGAAGPPLLLRHRGCGACFVPELSCSHCLGVLARREVRLS